MPAVSMGLGEGSPKAGDGWPAERTSPAARLVGVFANGLDVGSDACRVPSHGWDTSPGSEGTRTSGSAVSLFDQCWEAHRHEQSPNSSIMDFLWVECKRVLNTIIDVRA